jgi:uncharacterized protein YxjI
MKPRYIIEQKITVLANKYCIYLTDEYGNKAELVAFAQQKRLAFKEKVTFYTDESKSQVAFTFRAEKVMDVHGRFIVEDAAGALIGIFRKDFTQSLTKSTWHIVDQQDQRLLTIAESSATLAIIRRFGGLLPVIGEIIDIIVMFFKYHFTFIGPNNTEVGRYQKTTLFRDHYALSLTDEAYQHNDWRVLTALAVALDALQSR